MLSWGTFLIALYGHCFQMATQKNNNIYFLFVPFSRNAFLSLVTSFYEYCKCMTMDAPLQLVVAIFGFIIYEEEGNKVGLKPSAELAFKYFLFFVIACLFFFWKGGVT